MRLYPAIRSQMGDWNYYIVRMKMREIAQDVKLAHDVYEDTTLSTAVQRILKTGRVKNQIVRFLARRPDRFFSSIVVAAMEGEPHWHPVEMDTAVVPTIFSQSSTLRDSFGVLSFGDDPKYYALDGQHRVAAIKLIVDEKAGVDKPDGFDDDMLSVIVVLREEHNVPEREWLRRYRRLFSSLNRYAKKTDKDTDIIMDEDDLFAIVTRQLITDHPFFRAAGRERDSPHVKTDGKNLRSDDTYFTSLQTLYVMNEMLLSTRQRMCTRWSDDGVDVDRKGHPDKQVRPDEDFLDACHEELTAYWDAILIAFPEMREDPLWMRRHVAGTIEGKRTRDLLYFWPIGQEMLAELVRRRLDDAFPDNGHSGVAAMAEALRPLASVPWDLHEAPWRHLVLVPGPADDVWRMRSEDRKKATDVGKRVAAWVGGLDSFEAEEIAGLRADWSNLLYLQDQPTERADAMWDEVVAARARIVGGDS